MLDRFFDDSTIASQRYLVAMLFSEKLTHSEELSNHKNEQGEVCNIRDKQGIAAKKRGKNFLRSLCPKNGWNMGLEPTTLGTTNRCSNQLS
jgi:hypothetical protein